MSTGHKKWATGDLVEATAFNSYVQNQIVGVYDDSSARDAAFGGTGEPTLAEGMVCYLKDTNEFQIYSGSAWVALLDLDTISVSSGAYTITGDATFSSQVILTDGDNANPSIRWTDDDNTGLNIGDETNAGGTSVKVIEFVTDGNIRATIGADIADFKSQKISTTDIVTCNEVQADDGSSTDPSFTFASDTNLGFYRGGADQMALAADLDPVTSYTTLRRGTNGGKANIIGSASSSRRYKDNITNFTKSDWENIYNLQAVRFNWKEDLDPTQAASYGLIAEDAAAEIPELAEYRMVDGEGDSPVIDGFDYERMCVFLLEAVKDLKARIEQLEGGQ